MLIRDFFYLNFEGFIGVEISGFIIFLTNNCLVTLFPGLKSICANICREIF